MAPRIKQFALLCYRAALNLTHHFGVEMAGHLTFLSMLALFPYLILMISLAGILGQGESGRQFIELVLQHLPPEAVHTIRPRVVEIISGPPHGLLTFAVLGAVWTSSSAIESVRNILNRAYHVSAPPAYLSRRLMSILQILVFTFLFLLLMLLVIVAPVIVHYFTDFTGILVPIKFKTFMNHYFIFLGAAALFGMVASLYYVLPNVRQTRASILPGALLVVALWVGGATGVSFYLTKVSQLDLIYGSLSGLIATLIFFYVMILIFIYGAEFNHELARKKSPERSL